MTQGVWQKASGYSVRNWVDAAVGRYEQVIGHGIRFRKDEHRATEAAVAVQILNRTLQLGRPISVRIK